MLFRSMLRYAADVPVLHRIFAAGDPLVADYRGVADPELARERGVFVAEGRMVLRRVLEDSTWAVRSILLNAAAAHDLEPALGRLAPGVPIYVCKAAEMLGITGHDIHRGCLALVERKPALKPVDVLRAAQLVVVLEGVGNPDNVGGVFRNAAAFGADAVLLSPTCCDPLYRKAVRTSMASTLRVPFATLDDWPAALGTVREAGFSLVALTPRTPSVTLEAFVSRPRPARIALIVGTEGGGLSAAVETLADCRVSIPIRPEIDSLNLAVATGIALHRLGTGA